MSSFLLSWRSLVFVPLVVLVTGILWARLAPRPKNLGVKAGELSPCPDRPNCVSTQAHDGDQAMDPLPIYGTFRDSLQRLKEIIQAMPRTRVVKLDDNYLYCEFRSRLLGFIDDVEFYADPQKGVVQFRSASRRGYSDFGVNRERMQRIRSVYMQGIK